MTRRGVTLLELLVVVAVLGLLAALLLPALAGARGMARRAACLSNQRQLAMGWLMYAGDHDDRAMPLAFTDHSATGGGDNLFWWGADGSASGVVDFSRGFLAAYIDDGLRRGSVFQCPDQPEGTYRPQGPAGTVTSTYGYNGYYLCPPHTPGWSYTIGHRPWQRVSRVRRPSELLVFADTLLPGGEPRNTALRDPPLLFDGADWTATQSPTTCFRHAGGACVCVRADGSAVAAKAQPGWLVHEAQRIGSFGRENGPHYVPDWQEWR